MLLYHKKKISVYLKGGKKAATSYYRFYQFFQQVDADFRYNLMIPDKKWSRFFPISQQPKWKQSFIFLYVYFRVLRNLLADLIRRPEVIVVSRCIINLFFPLSFRFCLRVLKLRGSRIVWDFDDNIIGTEMTRQNFDRFSCLADYIIVGSPFLRELIKQEFRDKVIVMPTTDGDMYHLLTQEIQSERLNSFETTARFVWVGTFSTLHYVDEILPAFEIAGKKLRAQGRELQLVVLCDKELSYCPDSFNLISLAWEKQAAIDNMLCAHVGIMPLNDNDSTRGKCGFKLIQYLSVGLPILGSTVGINKDIIHEKWGIGLDELKIDSWASAIERIVKDVSKWSVASKNAYEAWNSYYSYEANLRQWEEVLNKCFLN
jgi:glycosyltransferase involved in cell wall biosynthesis